MRALLILMCSLALLGCGEGETVESSAPLEAPPEPQAGVEQPTLEEVEAPEAELPEGLEAPVNDIDDGPGMSRVEWIALYSPSYVRRMCHAEFYFRQCFDGATEARCTREMTQAIAGCMRSPEMGVPPRILSRADSERLTERISACAGDRYERIATEASRRIDSARCNDASNWTSVPE